MAVNGIGGIPTFYATARNATPQTTDEPTEGSAPTTGGTPEPTGPATGQASEGVDTLEPPKKHDPEQVEADDIPWDSRSTAWTPEYDGVEYDSELTEQEEEYSSLMSRKPERDDFPTGPGGFMWAHEYNEALTQWNRDPEQGERKAELEVELAPKWLERNLEATADSSEVGATVLDQAERLGMSVEVHADAEYVEEFGGYGTTVESDDDSTTVHVNAGSVRDPWNTSVFDEAAKVVAEAINVFGGTRPPENVARDLELIGLQAEDAELLQHATEGWKDPEAQQAVLTSLMRHELQVARGEIEAPEDETREDLVMRMAMHESAVSATNIVDDADVARIWGSPEEVANLSPEQLGELGKELRTQMAPFATQEYRETGIVPGGEPTEGSDATEGAGEAGTEEDGGTTVGDDDDSTTATPPTAEDDGTPTVGSDEPAAPETGSTEEPADDGAGDTAGEGATESTTTSQLGSRIR